MSEKTEKPTQFKLKKAKEKAQVGKSIELTSWFSLLVFLGMITALWPKLFNETQLLIRHLFTEAADIRFNLDIIISLQQLILSRITSMWLPFALSGGIAIILCSIAQTGLIWSGSPLVPDFKRLNFTQGFKKIFSIKTCFETVKSIFKLLCYILLLSTVLYNQLPDILKLMWVSPSQALPFIMNFLLKLILQLLMALSGIALIDTLYARWKFHKDNRMSRQEIKDEYKQKDGDPKIKNKIKQLQHQLRQKTASLNQVKTADVIITNPTHLAIALKYERGTMPAPKVVCKAQGEMVNQVKILARKYNVPVIEHKTFARILYQSIDLNHWISKDLFPVAATIFREIYQQRKINE